jgi:hypothetical protein
MMPVPVLSGAQPNAGCRAGDRASGDAASIVDGRHRQPPTEIVTSISREEAPLPDAAIALGTSSFERAVVAASAQFKDLLGMLSGFRGGGGKLGDLKVLAAASRN